jgi:serine/threonine protein kinase
VRSEVQRALQLLHDKGLVFGDLRRPNIMITRDGKVRSLLKNVSATRIAIWTGIVDWQRRNRLLLLTERAEGHLKTTEVHFTYQSTRTPNLRRT